jgi:hypothetical protein
MDRKIKELILEYPDGDISASEKRLVESVLENSPEYKSFYYASKMLWSVMDEWKGIEPRGDFVSAFWERLSQDEERRLSSRLGFLAGFKLRLGSAALISILVVTSIIGLRMFGATEGGEGMKVESGSVEKIISDKDKFDDQLLLEVDTTISKEPSEPLEVYGPWEELGEPQSGGTGKVESSFNPFIRPVDYGSLY